MIAREQGHKHIPKVRLVIAVIVTLLFALGAIVGIAYNLNSWTNILLITIAITSALFVLYQWFFPFSSAEPEVSPPRTHSTYRGVLGHPSPTDRRTIQQREEVVKEVYRRLIQSDITAIALTGMAGIGKSTLAALIYHLAEEQRRIGKGPFRAEALWLKIDPAFTFADLVGNIFEVLDKSLPDLSRLAPQNQAVVLFNALDKTNKKRLVILDQFENLLDLQTGHALPNQLSVGEWLDVINSQACSCKVLLTSVPQPKGTREDPQTCLQEYKVKGLEIMEGIDLLRKLGVKATDVELRMAVERCAGHAFALTLLVSLLQKRNLTLTTLLKDPTYAQLWTGDIARNFLDSIYTQLDQAQRRLLVAFSVYREPVLLNAAQAVINDPAEITKRQGESALDALLTQHLLQASGEGRYQLHTIVASYAGGHFVEGDEQDNHRAVLAAHAKAALYYQQQAAISCPSREKRRGISDVHDLIEAIWQYCQAGQWQDAFDLMERESIFADLTRWGNNVILLELYRLLLSDTWHPERSQLATIYSNLGRLYQVVGRMHEALKYYEQALSLRRERGDRREEGLLLIQLGQVSNRLEKKEQARNCYELALSITQEVGDRGMEGRALNNLGTLYDELGQKDEALKSYEQALRISQEISDKEVEGRVLNNLGLFSHAFGKQEEALKYLEQALDIFKELGNRDWEGVTLNRLGLVYNALGKKIEAFNYYQQAISIRREVGDRSGEGKTLHNIGVLYSELGHYRAALAFFLFAKEIFEELQRLSDCKDEQRWIETLHNEVGEKQFALLLADVEPQAHQIVTQALYEGQGHV